MRLGRLIVAASFATNVLCAGASAASGQTAEPAEAPQQSGGRASIDYQQEGTHLGAAADHPGSGGASVGAGAVVRMDDLIPVTGGGGARGGGYIGPPGDTGGGAGGGGGVPPLQCRYTPTQQAGPAGMTEMVRVCDTQPGIYMGETVLVGPEEPGAAATAAAPAPLPDPAVLAGLARDQLEFPGPAPRMNPGLEEGTYAQLPTWFWVEGWDVVSRSVTAGPVTATVTAEPVRHEWRIADRVRGDAEAVACEGPGSPPPEGAGLDAVPECGWTPVHSSAGQPTRGGGAGEPCFPATVTVEWAVSWESNLGPGGALGTGTSSTDVCLVVAELQAIG